MEITRIIGCKIRLKPTKKQEKLFIKSSGCSRFIYNWSIDQEKKSYEKNKAFLKDGVLRKKVTQMKKEKEFEWLKEVGSNVLKMAVKNACNSYISFFKKKSKYPKYKSRKDKMSFYVNYESMRKTKKGVRCEKLGDIKTSEKLPNLLDTEKHYLNPYISFDGKYWYISFSYKKKFVPPKLTNESLGIDLGIKELAVCSNGVFYKNINKTKEVKRLEKKLKRKQRSFNRKLEANTIGYVKNKPIYKKPLYECKNLQKIKKEIRLIYRRLSNIRNNYIHQITKSIVRTKPCRIVVEDLNIKGMIKNKYLAESILKQSFYKFISYLEYKCNLFGIEFIKADRFYPSSKTCSNCGSIKNDLKLSDRIYKCDKCNLKIDRDFNASLNLANYELVKSH